MVCVYMFICIQDILRVFDTKTVLLTSKIRPKSPLILDASSPQTEIRGPLSRWKTEQPEFQRSLQLGIFFFWGVFLRDKWTKIAKLLNHHAHELFSMDWLDFDIDQICFCSSEELTLFANELIISVLVEVNPCFFWLQAFLVSF